MKRSLTILIVVILLAMPLNIAKTQSIDEEAANATALINSNQILQGWQNCSNQVGLGTVNDISYTYSKSEGIMTCAKITVNTPLTSSLKGDQIVAVNYPGGTYGNITIIAFIDRVTIPGDTIKGPCVFNLTKGLHILFFANSTTQLLTGYIPVTTNDEGVISSATSEEKLDEKPITPLSQGSEPWIAVQEGEGYGFKWAGLHPYWTDLPLHYCLDPDGTDDIFMYQEFTAIQEAFATWEAIPDSGVSFTEDPQDDFGYDEWGDYNQPPDGHNVLGFPPSFPDPWVIGTCFLKVPSSGDTTHILEFDIAFNDFWTFTLNPLPFTIDMQSLATHEIGHSFGLGDLSQGGNEDQTMWGEFPFFSSSQRTPEYGDITGTHYIFPEINDAYTGFDGSNTLAGATQVERNTEYYGRMCNLPADVESHDYFKFYATAAMDISILLHPLDPKPDLDLKLYNPAGYLVATSASGGPGQNEYLMQLPIGTSGFWKIDICTSQVGTAGNGRYQFHITDSSPSRHVASIARYGYISGSGFTGNEGGMRYASPDGSEAYIYGLTLGTAYYIDGRLNDYMTGTSSIYAYCHTQPGYSTSVNVYVSYDDITWQSVGSTVITNTAPTGVYLGTTSYSYRYVIVCVYCTGPYVPGCVYIDNINVSN